jgi:hypothetical protein
VDVLEVDALEVVAAADEGAARVVGLGVTVASSPQAPSKRVAASSRPVKLKVFLDILTPVYPFCDYKKTFPANSIPQTSLLFSLISQANK